MRIGKTLPRLFAIVLTAAIPRAYGLERPIDPLAMHARCGEFLIRFSEQDSEVAVELGDLLHTASPKIAAVLDLPRLASVIVEIYPDQRSYNDFIMNRRLVDSPAVSGSGRMQLVSPKATIRENWIPYAERLNFAVHELVHLYLDQSGHEIAVWLEEGTAACLGSPAFTKWLLARILPGIGTLPTLEDLQHRYEDVKAADLVSASVVEFMIAEHGFDDLRSLLKHGMAAESGRGLDGATLDHEWRRYLARAYGIE